jgi:hypothetical protein
VSEAGILTVIGMAVTGLVWGLRIEGKVDAHDKELDRIRLAHDKEIAQLRTDTQAAVKEMRDDVRYIKERIDALVDRL